MMIKARKVGNSTILTVPSTFEIKDGEEYEVYQTDSGKIIYEPKDRNIFEGDWFNEDLTQDELFIKGEVYDSEWSE